MTEAVAEAPHPPKRPTIIRPSMMTNTDDEIVPSRPVPPRPAPSRPAPPPPGGGRPPPAVPNRPPQQRPSDGETRRPNVAPPSASHVASHPHSDTARNSRGSVKKRPEITIISAKPMSEVGFRGDKSPREDQPEKPADKPLVGPPRPNRPVSENKVPSRPHPPPSNRSTTSGQSADLINLLDDDDPAQSVLPPPMAVSEPSSMSCTLLDLEPDSNSQTSSLPHAPSRPTAPTARPVPQLASRPPPPHPRLDPSGSPTVPSRPPPLPSRPPISKKEEDDQPPTPPVRGSSIERSEEESGSSTSPPPVIPRGVPPVPASRPVSLNSGQPSKEVTQEPVRPTIIRPERPTLGPRNIKHDVTSTTPNDDKNKQSVIQDTSNNVASEPVYMKIDKQGQNDNGASENFGHGLPFKVKLKSTVESPDHEPPPVPSKQFDKKDSPPSIRTRPTVLPRPKPSAEKEESVEDSTKTATKRPTIIRPPPKPKRQLDGEGDNAESETKTAEGSEGVTFRKMPPVPAKRPNSVNLTEQLTQKDSAETGSASPRPVPARRPVSVAARFEQQIQDSQPGASKPLPPPKKSPATNLPGKIQDSVPEETANAVVPPKPKARSRGTPVGSSPETPPGDQDTAAETQVVRRQPSRPPERPRSMVLKTSTENDHRSSDKAPPPRPAGRPVSMMVPTRTTADSKPRPTRPIGGSVSEHRTSEDKQEEDESTNTSPPRPSERPVSLVHPTRRSEEEEDEVVKSKPQRPTGPPPKPSPPQKEKLENKPSRPSEGPPRPISAPEKPPTPHGGRSRGRPTKPPFKKSGAKTPELPPRPGPDHDLYHYTLTVPHAIAQHDYAGNQDDELSFKTEDVVVLIRRLDSDWLIGRVGEKEGMFPAGFVAIIHPLHDEIPISAIKQPEMPSWDSPEPAKRSKPVLTSGPRCVARFDFDGEGQDDLTFEEDDQIKLTGRVGTEWLRGELNGKTGIFPLAFVEIIEDLPPETEDKSADGRVTAMFDFEGHDDELSLQAGQKVKVLSQVNSEWLYGETDNGKTGKFPASFIDHIPTDLPRFESTNEDKGETQADQVPAKPSEDFVDQSETDQHSSPSANESQQPSPRDRKVNLSLPHCVATYDYEGQHEDDLSFKTGDVIQLLEKVGSDWMRGCYNGRQGLFPLSFVSIKKDLPDGPGVQSSKGASQAKAVYDFDGENENELTFKTGDIIQLTGNMTGSMDWLTGSLNGRSGIFPASFVEKIN